MNDDDIINPAESDEQRESENPDADEALPPEQEAEERQRKIDEIQRKVADGN